MATTTRWKLPYPSATDPPLGGSQLTALATAADTALTTLTNGYPNCPWASFNGSFTGNLIPQGITVTTNISGLYQPSYSTIFAATANTLTTSRTGWYQMLGRLRLTVVIVPLLVPGGRAVATVETPPQTAALTSTTPTYASNTIDVPFGSLFYWQAGQPLRITVANYSGSEITSSVNLLQVLWATA